MANIAFELRGALRIVTANGDFGFVFYEEGFADPTVFGKFECGGVFCAFGHDHAHHFGDDVAAFFEYDGIAFPNVFALDFFGIVQCGAADCGASQLHGFEVRHWGDDAGAPDLKGNFFEHGFGLFG